ncbi:hypothetical protein E8F20_05830 [Pseudomonas sp. BN415]|uniref:hypothetical protein n=1 Tax=Pseudomonas sp. BN415 TaxID=2567889 RepID=UPI002455A6CE|nr:hypothetical protein [Pseudomonas sp. BN415]MDH4581395.1 hypothetical protein [Pseudomonas sp. BN415]
MTRVLALFFLLSPVVLADTFQPSHDCSEPYKPYEFTSEFERDNFINEVEDYKQCISDFVDEQNDAVRKHQSAAQEAIDEWNSYANSLN